MSVDIALETLRAMVTASILLYLLHIGRRERFKSQQGWQQIIIGFSLILFASVLDITDNFPSLNDFIVIGRTDTEAFLEKFVGYLGGLVFLFIGYTKWFPLISNMRKANADLRIAATAFESQEGMLITDADNVILRVNRAFTDITGYTADEAIGKNPRLLSSGRHDASFFAAMWERINRTGMWEGEIWNRRKNGETYPEHLTITAVKNANGIMPVWPIRGATT